MRTVLRHTTTTPFTSGCRLATGRSAILHTVERFKPDIVLMPCYVPDGVIRPVQHAGVEIVFYRLDQWMRPDEADITRRLAKKPGRAMLIVIHYFGWRQPTEHLSLVVRARGGILFEDCAHCLPGPAGVGQDGDVVLYSLNKFLPVADGAILASRNPALDLSITEHLVPLPRNVIGAYQAHLEANGRIAAADHKREADAIGRAHDDSKSAYEVYYDHINSDMSPREQSAQSRAIEAMTDFAMMSARRACFAHILDRCLLRDRVWREDARFAYPIRCNGKRREIDTALYREGFMAATLTERWDHVQPQFAIETDFYDDHLLLPMGESVTADDTITMAKVLEGFA